MHVVVFVARTDRPDAAYDDLAARLRDLALGEFGCRRFEVTTEGDREIAVSWWDHEDDIQRWRRHPLHVEAQRSGRRAWYSTYDVTVARVARSYGHGEAPRDP